MASTQRTRALDLLKAKGMLRLKDFIAENIEPETLARLVRDEQIIRPARGLYQLPDAQIDAAHTLAEAAVLVPKGIVCLISALQFHALTLQMPSTVWMAIERTAWKPTISYPPIRFVRFSGWAMTEGVERYPFNHAKSPSQILREPSWTASDTAIRSASTSQRKDCAKESGIVNVRRISSGNMRRRRGCGRSCVLM